MTATPLRSARFAGTWYPGEPDALREAIARAAPATAPEERVRARAVVAPHAGYRYSLGVAAATYARVEVPATAVVLCPNHTVPPPVVSVWSRGGWETPLGTVPVDEELAGAILAECPGTVDDPAAHEREHAVELHLPLLQARQPALRCVPVVVAAPGLEALEALGQGLARAIGAVGREVLLVASTDMTHQEPDEVARRQDQRALARLLALDPAGLLEVCQREAITMCGVRPTTAALCAALALGATRAELVAYATSGDVSGDRSRVVGYAGALVA